MKSTQITQITLCIIAAAAFSGVTAASAETLTYPDLVHRLTDMEHLAVLPPEGEATALASSYDRASQYDAAKDQYIHWDANADGKGFIREEGDTVVMADIKGPGCIWRIWSAAPGYLGHVKIYLDDSKTPAIDMPFEPYFSPKKGNPFPWPNLAYGHAGERGPGSRYNPGGNIYVPISFQKSCKIVGDKAKPGNPKSGWGQYFQFTYTRFAPGTVVPTFKLPIPAGDAAALTEADRKLGQCGQAPEGPRPAEKTEASAVTVPAHQMASVADLQGPEAITALKVKLDLPVDAQAQRTLLRQLTVRVTWDDDKAPAIWSPLGDFFGYIGGAGSYQVLPVGLNDDGTFYSYWYMPYGTRAKIEVGNDSGSPVAMHWEVTHAPLDKPIGDLARFHAKWHRDAFPVERKDRFPDWTLLTTQGRGRYVGTMLHVWNPRGGWWGEGDDKFFIDGEKFPSTFGTGSEDYFGYAWGCASRFIRAFHAQPINESNLGNVDDSRWHISDNVPFQSSFDGFIEKYFPNQPPANNPYHHYALYAAEVYWYLSAGGTDSYSEVPVDQRVGYFTRPKATYSEPGAIEGESMQLVDPWSVEDPGGVQSFWDQKPGVWSGDMHYVWGTQRPPGVEKLKLRLPVEKTGKYRVLVRLTHAPYFGIFQLSLDGKHLGAPIDSYSEQLAAADPVEIGTVDLTAGDHVLSFEATGNNPAIKSKSFGFGLDYVKLVPAQ